MKHLRSIVIPVLLLATTLLVVVDLAAQQKNSMTPDTSVTPTTVAATQEIWPDWSYARTKIVPIVSLGTPGIGIGFAQVTGPADRVDTVRAVVQLDAEFKHVARARVFVPSRQLVGLDRVQGVAVTAVLQYGLFRF